MQGFEHRHGAPIRNSCDLALQRHCAETVMFLSRELLSLCLQARIPGSEEQCREDMLLEKTEDTASEAKTWSLCQIIGSEFLSFCLASCLHCSPCPFFALSVG